MSAIFKKFCLTIFLLSSFFCSKAQFLDTLGVAFKQQPTPYFHFNSFNSFISGTRAHAFGLKAGVDFGKKIRFGMGYYWLTTDIVENRYVPEEQDTFRTEVKCRYVTTDAEYIFLRKGPWQVSVPITIGFGNSYFVYPKPGEGDKITGKHPVILLEPAIAGHYKIVKWVGVGFGFGYCFMLKNNPEMKDNLSGPLYVLGLKVFLGEIYKSVFPKRENKKTSK